MCRNLELRGISMAQQKKPYLKLARPISPDEQKRRKRHRRKEAVKRNMPLLVLVLMVLLGTYLLLINKSYTSVRSASVYPKSTSDTNQYEPFAGGIVRYSRDGIALLNKKNEELWIQPSQIQDPIIDLNNQSFAVADRGGNSILVFSPNGIKGEIETTLPIEKITVSNQGIVSAILKDENNPMIVTYDATGNILVENQIALNTLGYPTALELSDDGTVLGAAYLSINGGMLKSRVIYYNFANSDQEANNFEVSQAEYDNTVVADIFFMNSATWVCVTDHSFLFYEGKDKPVPKQTVELEREIRSVFYTGRCIGCVLLNKEKSGYEIQLYNRQGRQVMSREFAGEFDNVRMIGDNIIMHEGMNVCIISKTGILRYKGRLEVEPLLMIPAAGINRYYVMSANELRIIYLTN